MSRMNWVMAGALWGLLGVGLGAFGAHGLKTVATEQGLAWWETAARYQLFHALALVLLGLLQHHRPGGDAAGWSFLLGSAFFSGTLYAMALGAPRWLGAVTPIGGLGMMLGWLLLALHGVLDRGHGPEGIDHLEGHDRVHAERDLVRGHDLLARDVHHLLAQVHRHDLRARDAPPERVSARGERRLVATVAEEEAHVTRLDRDWLEQGERARQRQESRQLLVLDERRRARPRLDAARRAPPSRARKRPASARAPGGRPPRRWRRW